MLYQSGYLTIKGYDPTFRLYNLAYPNAEVRYGFTESLLPDTIYVFEFKFDGTPDEALAQIDSKQYALPYQANGRRIVKAGVNFDSATRTIGEWKIS